MFSYSTNEDIRVRAFRVIAWVKQYHEYFV